MVQVYLTENSSKSCMGCVLWNLRMAATKSPIYKYILTIFNDEGWWSRMFPASHGSVCLCSLPTRCSNISKTVKVSFNMGHI